uniref:Uncharacterized protein n=1 Tax=Anguilla anguilla TaxID=7936 RepID=A0A0E9W3U7_ANGAN
MKSNHMEVFLCLPHPPHKNDWEKKTVPNLVLRAPQCGDLLVVHSFALDYPQ